MPEVASVKRQRPATLLVHIALLVSRSLAYTNFANWCSARRLLFGLTCNEMARDASEVPVRLGST